MPAAPGPCWVQVTADSCKWINADCLIEKQTGFTTGVDGKECLIHWLIGTAPPPPTMRLISKENEIDVLWDNRSETTPDLRLSVIDFESYRIWRADNWTRPFGSDVTTGPPANLWALLAEYDLPRNNIGADNGLDAIRYVPNVPDHAVQFDREWLAAHPFEPPPQLPDLSPGQRDTALALARGVRYYRFTDPPFADRGRLGGRCPGAGRCPPLVTATGPVFTRCNRAGFCQETQPPPHSGAHYFYSVTATDHALVVGPGGRFVPAGPGLAGEPSSSFEYVTPPEGQTPTATKSGCPANHLSGRFMRRKESALLPYAQPPAGGR